MQVEIADWVNQAPLGRNSSYITQYTPGLLCPLPRKTKRDEIGVREPLPFHGFDTWNAYEVSWLNNNGKPIVAIVTFDICCTSKNIIESKSFKLYLNSFNNTKFANPQEVQATLSRDLLQAVAGNVEVQLHAVDTLHGTMLQHFTGECLDDYDVVCDTYTIQPAYLTSDKHNIVEEILYSNLLKSNCLVTQQPDWGTVSINYYGPKINKRGLLQYIVSFRNHAEFHEQCVERIFMDIMRHCLPQKLTVEARYTRRGGLDINPIRSIHPIKPAQNIRTPRQ